jgi:hypothetical protein
MTGVVMAGAVRVAVMMAVVTTMVMTVVSSAGRFVSVPISVVPVSRARRALRLRASL